jgi:hypothetical protein
MGHNQQELHQQELNRLDNRVNQYINKKGELTLLFYLYLTI